MQNNKPFKKTSAKHQPKGLLILFEDNDIIVVDKVSGLLTVGTDREKQRTAHYLLNDYVKKGVERSKKRVYIVHRLDRDTSGVLVFAKNEKSKKYLQENWKSFSKNYCTVVHGVFSEKEGEVVSYLKENKSFRVFSVKESENGKYAKTGYTVMRASDKYTMLDIKLFTGRKNQIRVHMADIKHSVVGDKIYGIEDKSIKRLALHSTCLKLTHPNNKKEMIFNAEIPTYFKSILK